MDNVDQPIRISLFAPDGRMGKAIAATVAEDSGFIIDQDGGDVILDFSAPAALAESLASAVARNKPLLLGTTGLDQNADAQIAQAAQKIAILRAPNTSLGIAVLADVVERVAQALRSDWDIEISEIHHRMKADAPSGTALLLGEAASRGREIPRDMEVGRAGTGLERKAGAIGFASLRGGTVAGEHHVMFLGNDEELIFSHRAESRKIFARGALAGARFIAGKPPGLYSMRDVIKAL